MKKYLTKKAYVSQEEFYHLEINDSLIEEVKDRIKNNEHFKLTDEEIQLIDENVLCYCFSIGEHDAITDAQRELMNKRDDKDIYNLSTYIEEILNELVWDCECEYGDSEVDYCDHFIETY